MLDQQVPVGRRHPGGVADLLCHWSRVVLDVCTSLFACLHWNTCNQTSPEAIPVHTARMEEGGTAKVQCAAAQGQAASNGDSGRKMTDLPQGGGGVLEDPFNGCGDVPSVPGEETAVPPEALNYTPTPEEICKVTRARA